jgi:Tol biopolymer transport system component
MKIFMFDHNPKHHLAINMMLTIVLCFCNAYAESYFVSDGDLVKYDGVTSSVVVKDIIPGAINLRLLDFKVPNNTTNDSGALFLILDYSSKQTKEGSDEFAGFNLWLLDLKARTTLMADDCIDASLSPDGKMIAYTTQNIDVQVKNIEGRSETLTINRARDARWHPNRSLLVYSKVPQELDLWAPGKYQLALFDLFKRTEKILTDGTHDDVRPVFSPTGDWIIFVSGDRTGIASFWGIDTTGSGLIQITNIGILSINESFVPVPYQTELWSSDGTRLIYDHRNGSIEKTWMITLQGKRKMLNSESIADGLYPKWLEDETSISVQRKDDISSSYQKVRVK